jgi:hypothetical protein
MDPECINDISEEPIEEWEKTGNTLPEISLSDMEHPHHSLDLQNESHRLSQRYKLNIYAHDFFKSMAQESYFLSNG